VPFNWWHTPETKIPCFSEVEVTWGPLQGRRGVVVDDFTTEKSKQTYCYDVEFFDRDLLEKEGFSEESIRAGAGYVCGISANNLKLIWRFGDPKPEEKKDVSVANEGSGDGKQEQRPD